MVTLRTIKNRAELRRHTSLTSLGANATRWSSAFMRLERSCVSATRSSASMRSTT
ncbi:hypothetical protein PC116_g16917 [Phytophthora cactorum]|nr:hypothetical protein PC116_g16917 [Phytophthora cactorum]